MFLGTPLLALAWLCPQIPEPLGEFHQGLYAGTTKSGQLVELNLNDTPNQTGLIHGTLLTPGSGMYIPVSGELAEKRLRIYSAAENVRPSLLAEGSLVLEPEAGGRVARLELRFLRGLLSALPPPERIIPPVNNLADLVGNRIILTHVYRTFSATLTADNVVVCIKHPLLVSAPSPLREAVLDLRRKALSRAEDEYRIFIEELEDDDFTPRSRDYEELWGITLASGSIVSMMANISCYGGGAHPNYWFKSETLWYDGENVHQVRLADLFQPCSFWLDRLSDRILMGLRSQQASDVINGNVKELHEDDLPDWALTSTGIEFFFAPYSMGCYADGSFIVHVPYSEIQDLLAKNGPASCFWYNAK